MSEDENPQVVEATVLDHRSVAREQFVLALQAPTLAAAAVPGQFVMVRCGEPGNPLLPRAYSFYGTTPATGRIELLYRVVGAGTQRLNLQREGMSVRLWGPLGNRFTAPTSHRVVLVGGGVGVPPLVFWAQWLAEHQPQVRVDAILGAGSADLLVGCDRLAEAGVQVQVTTDDGSAGHHGRVTDLLSTEFSGAQVYACGPMPMLRAVAERCRMLGLSAELALEAPMACGIGACLGCTVPREGGGFFRVCTEGPVFPAGSIDWSREIHA